MPMTHLRPPSLAFSPFQALFHTPPSHNPAFQIHMGASSAPQTPLMAAAAAAAAQSTKRPPQKPPARPPASVSTSAAVAAAAVLAALAAARRIQPTVLGASASALRIRTTVIGSSTAVGSHSLMSQDLLRRLPHKEVRTVFGLPRATYLCQQQSPLCTSCSNKKVVAVGKTASVAEALREVNKGSPTEGLADLGNLKKLEYRILKLEALCSFFKNNQWMFLGPIVVLLMAVPSAIYVIHGVSTVKERQKNTAEQLSDLNRQIEYLERQMNTVEQLSDLNRQSNT